MKLILLIFILACSGYNACSSHKVTRVTAQKQSMAPMLSTGSLIQAF